MTLGWSAKRTPVATAGRTHIAATPTPQSGRSHAQPISRPPSTVRADRTEVRLPATSRPVHPAVRPPGSSSTASTPQNQPTTAVYGQTQRAAFHDTTIINRLNDMTHNMNEMNKKIKGLQTELEGLPDMQAAMKTIKKQAERIAKLEAEVEEMALRGSTDSQGQAKQSGLITRYVRAAVEFC